MTSLYLHSSRWLLVMLTSSLLCMTHAFAADGVTPQALRAALLFNYIKFTEWPAKTGNDTQLLVCIATADIGQFAAIKALEGRLVRKQTIATTAFNFKADCDVLYVDSIERWKEVRSKLGDRSTLTVGEFNGFVANGGMIEIFLSENGAGFDISQHEAKRAGLRFYPQLLRLAHSIIEQ